MLTENQKNELLFTLNKRFNENMRRHSDIKWENVLKKLVESDKKLNALYQMEITGGEPDVVDYEEISGEYIFFDCSAESPKERRSTCYDRKAWEERKEHKPKTDAMTMAEEIGIELLSEENYRYLQALGEFDLKTSSWLKTPAEIRKLGGAIFGDRRYDSVFVYHNGVQSYYGARGFRGSLNV